MQTVETQPRSVPPTGSGTAVLLSALGGAGVALMLARLGSGHTEVSRRFADLPEFEVWAWILAAEVAAAAAVAVAMWPAVRLLVAGAGRRAVIGAVGASFAVGLLLLFGPRPVSGGGHSPLWLLTPRLQVASLIVGILIAPALVGLLLIPARLSAIGREVATEDAQIDARRVIADLLWTRMALQRFLVSFALLVAGGVLAAGAMRNALLADGAAAADYPVVGILAYGGVLTVICALLFIPAYVTWQEQVAGLRDRLLPLPNNGLPSHDWYQARNDFEAFFSSRSSAGSVLTAAFSILAPLAGSLVTTLIPAS
jgi:hypothetical protein